MYGTQCARFPDVTVPEPGSHEVCAKGGLQPRQLARLATLARRELQSTLTVDRLARECRLSVGYFTRAFRATMGTTPYRWLLALRLEHAKALLVSGTTPIADVALDCGFWDQAHFTRTFGRYVGVSPAAWAKAERRAASRGAPDAQTALAA